MVERGEDRGGRTDHIHQPHREERRGLCPGREVQAVEVGERAEDAIGLVAMHSAVADDLVVRVRIGDLGGPAPLAHERDIGESKQQIRDEPRRREGQASALAATVDRHTRRVHERMGPGRFHGTDGVGDEAVVVVGLRVRDAARDEAGILARCRAGLRVRRVARSPRAALAADIHDEVGVAGGRGKQPVEGSSAAATVADVLDHARQATALRERRGRGVVRGEEPALDRLTAEAGERHVRHVHGRESGVDGLETGFQIVRSGVGQCIGPEGVEVGRLVAIRLVDPQFLERQIE